MKAIERKLLNAKPSAWLTRGLTDRQVAIIVADAKRKARKERKENN